MNIFNLNYTGQKLAELLAKIDAGEMLTAEEKQKVLDAIENNGGGVSEEAFNEAIESLRAELELLKMNTVRIVKYSQYNIDGFMRPAGTLSTSSSYSYTDYIYIGDCKKLTIHSYIKSASVSPVVWFDADKIRISGVTATAEQYAGFYKYELDVPEKAEYAVFSCYKDTSKETYVDALTTRESTEEEEVVDTSIGYKVYMSPTGNDGNDGKTSSTPVATLARVRKILDPSGELVLMAGDYENLSINLGEFKILTGYGARLIYYREKHTSATLMEGSSKIYTTTCIGSYNISLWQHDIPDERSLILEVERHPLQGRKTHRLSSTRIRDVKKVDSTSTDLAGYLATIESSEDYLYYCDGTTLYFTAPNSDFATYPIIYGNNVPLSGTSSDVWVKGIKVMYTQLNVGKLKGKVEDVAVLGGYAGGSIVWDNGNNLELIRCEAGGSDNDGINGHSTGHITCYDCWMHDCLDDGESCHEECRITHYGGLCEYNDSGCTPASGGDATYYNMLLRHCNCTGFSSQAGASVMVCNSCIALDCGDTGFNVSPTALGTLINCVSNCGFVVDGANVKKVNCITIE